MKTSAFFLLALLAFSACEGQLTDEPVTGYEYSLPEVARMLSELPVGQEQMAEVLEAVSSSSGNGYDEEYMMKDLFECPGTGVGETGSITKAARYDRPMRSLIADYLASRVAVKSEDAVDVSSYMEGLAASDLQIYWPFSEQWDGETLPVMTFDPGTDTRSNRGYEMVVADDGTRSVREVTVTEEMARQRPVWVVNCNDDSGFKSLEMFRRENPGWGEGGSVVVRPASGVSTKATTGEVKTLILKKFTMKRQYDSWFRGASEFFVKCGCLENFTASTEAEMRLYSPSVTDFMIVVKRSLMGYEVPFNAVLISDWTEQLEAFAFLITEDDGGTRTTWKSEATVKVNSKAYGVTVELPLNIRDDIVWRGQITSRFLKQYNNVPSHFGDVDLTFEIK